MMAADLRASFPVPLDAVFAPVGKHRVSAKLANAGDAVAAGLVTLNLYASADTSLDAGDTLLGGQKKKVRLQPGKFSQFPIAFSTPPALAAGDYHILFQVVPDSSIGDSNSANDLAFSTATHAIQRPTMDPSVALGTIPTGTITVGKKEKPISATIVLGNAGTVTSKGRATLRLYAASSTSRSDSDTLLLGKVIPVNLPAGKTKSIVLRGKLAATVPSGTFYLIAELVPTTGTSDLSTGNDTASTTTTLLIANPAVPQALPVFSTSLGTSLPTVFVGTPADIRFSVGVQNATIGSSVELDEVNANGTFVAKVADLALDVGQTAIYAVDSTVSADAIANRYFVAKLADPLLSVPVVSATASIATAAEPTADQLAADNAGSFAATNAAQNIIDANGTSDAALAAAMSALSGDPNVIAGTLNIENELLSWKTVDGLLQGVDAGAITFRSGPGVGVLASGAVATDTVSSPAVKTPAAAANTSRGSAIVIAANAVGFEPQEEGDDIANILTAANFNVTLYRHATALDAGISIEQFKNLGSAATFAFTGHGFLMPHDKISSVDYGSTFSTQISPTPTFDLAYKADLETGRLMKINDVYAVTPAFIKKYDTGLNKTIIYAGGCHEGSADRLLANAFLENGAAAFVGFTTTVSSPFAYPIGLAMYTGLVGTSGNTVGEIAGINKAIDPATMALFVAYGDLTAKLPAERLKSNLDYDTLTIRYAIPAGHELYTRTVLAPTFGGATYSVGQGTTGSGLLGWSGPGISTGTQTVTLNLDAAVKTFGATGFHIYGYTDFPASETALEQSQASAVFYCTLTNSFTGASKTVTDGFNLDPKLLNIGAPIANDLSLTFLIEFAGSSTAPSSVAVTLV